ncbi:putative RNA recognition motif domain, nucleotide-binding alpha-beta plait domain superfamily [Helianthus annuus]|uniref:RNA recognition motif domain, nucleotide-binding alpha-beta plait domain superfamily n=1 Tax=Helianthus annuus TaxID=4232 RepID=A0A9K3JFY8_HELAN|nr:putative RNA recognition motif domain, nucleotide-binding alpha-beta plait domain superfamily [Helianthus annuus]KAJ0773863.1 putative RNA recognition motif domain, nucleotide-binding alpha-beta plait domain superfamily [Helianthus annuus]
MVGQITKLFISNLPDGSTPWELRKCLENYGEIVGTFVAKKRDKFGLRFGFASFKDVASCQELLNSLKGVKMGECRLKVNIARFAAENAGMFGSAPEKTRGPSVYGEALGKSTTNFRDFRSYSYVVGSSHDQRNPVKGGSGDKWGEKLSVVQSVIIPDRSSAFSELSGLALVGTTVNLETLVDFDRLLSIAKVVVANVQYLGGMTLLISFHDKASAARFLESKSLWGPWFSRLDGWNGQSLPLERVAWLKLCGIPLHLFSSDVMSLVGGLFGKVLHVPKGVEEDQDLSVCRVGVLVGEVDRINVGVAVKWRNRSYKIRVEEDLNDWVPDSLRAGGTPEWGGGSPSVFSPMSSPVVDGSGVADWGNVESLHGECGGGVEGSVGGDGANPHNILSPVHADREKVGGNDEVGSVPAAGVSSCPVSKDVGPEAVGNFLCGAGGSRSKPTRRRRMGHVLKKAQSASQQELASSPVVERPSKRPRETFHVEEPGFGFVGFTDRARNIQSMEVPVEEGGEVRIDLNVRANSEGVPIGFGREDWS